MKTQRPYSLRHATTWHQALASALLASTTACGVQWYASGKTVQEFDRDWYECRREASTLPPTSSEAAAMRNSCMRLRGWQQK